MESDIKTLLHAHQTGDGEAFRHLYDRTVDRVFGFVAGRITPREMAEEVTQDTFVELHRSLRRFVYQSDSAFYAFLFLIARRQLIKRYGVEQKHATNEFKDEIHLVDPKQEMTLAVQQALSKLDEVSRDIVLLHYWSRFSFAEIGACIHMTEGAVRTRHHRAKEVLASVLNA